MLRYIAGNSISSAIKCSDLIIKKNKIPIINYAIENIKNNDVIFTEHINLCNLLNSKYKVAIKLSSFNFDIDKIDNLIEIAKDKSIQVIIDAEKGVDNDKYHEISNDLVIKHNINKFHIVKTYQMYRKDSFDQLMNDYSLFNSKDIYFGTKLVRGAYWNSENKDGHLFTKKKYTDLSYDNAIKFLSMNNHNNYNILATHNINSINLGVSKNKNQKIFDFAHLMGMSENTYSKFTDENVHVYIPYGPYKEMIPYLLRRLYENIDTIKYMIK